MTMRAICGAAVLALLAGQAQAVSGGGFALSVRGQAEDGAGYVRMAHGTTYAVCFRNDRDRRADAELSIDGLSMGTWRLGPYRSACVERPVEDTGQFTFYRADSADGYAVGSGQVARGDKGRVSVRFIPEVERYVPPPPPPVVIAPPPPMPYAYDQAAPMARESEESMGSLAAPQRTQRYSAPSPERDLGAGVTGLSGESGQRFRTARAIERDWANAVTLELRLVHDPAYDRPVDPRPLPGRYDRYAPPPVGY